MGYIAHRALIVTGYHRDIEKAHTKAVELCGDLVSTVVQGRVNGGASFFVAPDCSKEGWADSDRGDDERNNMINWLQEQRSNRLYFDYVVVRYGGDDEELTTVEKTVDDSDEDDE